MDPVGWFELVWFVATGNMISSDTEVFDQHLDLQRPCDNKKTTFVS